MTTMTATQNTTQDTTQKENTMTTMTATQNTAPTTQKESNMTTIPTPTIDTKIIDAQEITRTSWTVGDYTLWRFHNEGAPHARWLTRRLNPNAPQVDEDGDSWIEDTPVTYCVNWSARGDQTPAEALEYGASIMAAAEAARVFTAIRAENK